MEIKEINANSVNTDQTPHSAASGLCLHCLPVFLFWEIRLKLFKLLYFNCSNRKYNFYTPSSAEGLDRRTCEFIQQK